jgi:cell wall-associated NlpC family hydrolase
MIGKGRSAARVAVAALIVLPALVAGVAPSAAAPSRREVEQARARLAALEREIEILQEEFLAQKVELDQLRAELASLREEKADAEEEAAAYRAELEARAVEAFTGSGSQLDLLLGAQSLQDLSDRVEFMGALAQSDADLATKAEAAGARAEVAAEQLTGKIAEEQAKKDALQGQLDRIRAKADEARELYQELDRDYRDWLAAQRAAEEAAQQQIENGGSPVGGGGGFVPPPDATKAQIAIAAAESVIGTPYVFGGADPDVGFDCSGLTMWAYAQAGVSLPHSSAAQYASLPHVSREDLQPGDLLFFYSPISHVSLYVGGGQHIDASHPGPGGEVAREAVYWQHFVAAARPT